jgi:hypothetical protein
MPEEATPMATCPSRRIDANNMLYTKVLPDPPRPSRKKTAPSPWATTVSDMMAPTAPLENDAIIGSTSLWPPT